MIKLLNDKYKSTATSEAKKEETPEAKIEDKK